MAGCPERDLVNLRSHTAFPCAESRRSPAPPSAVTAPLSPLRGRPVSSALPMRTAGAQAQGRGRAGPGGSHGVHLQRWGAGGRDSCGVCLRRGRAGPGWELGAGRWAPSGGDRARAALSAAPQSRRCRDSPAGSARCQCRVTPRCPAACGRASSASKADLGTLTSPSACCRQRERHSAAL